MLVVTGVVVIVADATTVSLPIATPVYESVAFPSAPVGMSAVYFLAPDLAAQPVPWREGRSVATGFLCES